VNARTATAAANANIALAKYWGKRDVAGNVPATPSLSLTLMGLETITRVTFDDATKADRFTLDGAESIGRPLERVVAMLDAVRARAKTNARAVVESRNSFPTASGLASSASGFAALARASTAALGLDVDAKELSRIARRASASAARSVFGGFVALGTEDDAAAEPIAPPSHWPIAMVVAATTFDAKPIGSTEAMERTRATSPYWDAWIADSPKIAGEIRSAIQARDLQRLGDAVEASAMRMHACAMSARPAIVYWTDATMRLLAEVRAMRAKGIGAWATIDAGPHVKIVCDGDDASSIAERVSSLSVRVIVARPGEGVRVLREAREACEEREERERLGGER
jgi:diphosphomevalonate decarboxylase